MAVGVDIGDTEVKVAVAKRKKNEEAITVTHLFSVPIEKKLAAPAVKEVPAPEGEPAGGKKKEQKKPPPLPTGSGALWVDEGRLASILRESLGARRVRDTRCGTAVCGNMTVLRFLEMPHMEDDVLRSAIRFEAKNYIPFEVDDCVLDATVLDSFSSIEGKKIRVLFVAAKEALIQQRIRFLAAAGLDTALVEPWATALYNFFVTGHGKELDPGRGTLLIDLGARAVRMLLLTGRRMVFARESFVGSGNDLTDHLCKRFDISPLKAEAYKRGEVDGGNSAEVGKILKGKSGNLVLDIRRMLDYYSKNYDGEVRNVYLYGGMTALPGIGRLIEEQTNRAVHVEKRMPSAVQVAADAGGPGGTSPSKYAIALGLALGQLG